jgi:hypothetical protein
MKTLLLHALGFTLVSSLISGLVYAAPDAGGNTAADKDHVLFVGSDFVVFKDGKPHPVIGAGKRTVIIQEGNKKMELPLRTVKDIRISRGLKLSNLTATVDGIEAVMSSDAANAEAADQAMTGIALMVMGEMAIDKAYGDALRADMGRGAYDSNSKIRGNETSIAAAEANQRDTRESAVRTLQQVSMQKQTLHDWVVKNGAVQTNTSDEIEITPELSNRSASLMVASSAPGNKSQAGTPAADKSGDNTAAAAKQAKADGPERKTTIHVRDAGGGQSDRFDLEFRISAQRPLDSAYVVVVTEYTAPNHPGEIYRRVLSTSVGSINSTPRKISLYQIGFPAGFTLRTFTVDVYANGQEVATNLSDTKMTFNRDEAFEYIVANYLASHQGKTLPPAAVLMAPRSELRQVAGLADARSPIYVTVDANGNVVATSADAQGQGKPTAPLLDALKHFRFIPALDKGLPTEGRARLVVADFGP